MITTMNIKDFSARSAKGLGGANGSADVPVRIVAGLTLAFCRAAMMLLLMLLTTATAWAIKTETPTSYSITYNTVNGKKFHISAGSSDTDSWTASVTSGNIYWKANETHLLANAMTPSAAFISAI